MWRDCNLHGYLQLNNKSELRLKLCWPQKTSENLQCYPFFLAARGDLVRSRVFSPTHQNDVVIIILVICLLQQQQSGAVEACWAHNPEVRGSKPRSAKCFFLSNIFFSHSIYTIYTCLTSVNEATTSPIQRFALITARVKYFSNLLHSIVISGAYLRERKYACAYNLTLQVGPIGFPVTAKPVIKGHSKIESNKNDLNGSLMKVENIRSSWSIL